MNRSNDASKIEAIPVNGRQSDGRQSDGQEWPAFTLTFTAPFRFTTKVYPAGTNPQEAIEAAPLDFALIENEVAALCQEQGLAVTAEFGDDVLRVEADYGGEGNRITFAGDGSLPPPFYSDEDVSAFMREAAHLVTAVVKANGISATSLPKDLVTLMGEAERFVKKFDLDTDKPWADVADIVSFIALGKKGARSALVGKDEAYPGSFRDRIDREAADGD